MLKKIRHVGMVVKEFEAAIEKFNGFGFRCTEVSEIKEFGIKVAFFPIGDSLIELLCYTEPERCDHVLMRKDPINHICFEVDDLETSIRDFEKNGAKLVEGFPRAGAHGRVAFFYPDTTENVLIEICQI